MISWKGNRKTKGPRNQGKFERKRENIKNRARTGAGWWWWWWWEASNLFFLPETRKPRRETLENCPLLFFCSRFPFEHESCALSLCFLLTEREALSEKIIKASRWKVLESRDSFYRVKRESKSRIYSKLRQWDGI